MKTNSYLDKGIDDSSSRTKNSVRNLRYALVGQMCNFVINFVARIVFINTLGGDYLGLSGLFTNILSVLSLTELGVNAAMTYSLYEPLANGNSEKISSLLVFFRRIHISIGVLILAIGAIVIPFLPLMIAGNYNIPDINTIYYLFVLNSAVTYFFSYKRCLLIADQKRYVDSFYHYVFRIIIYALQMAILLSTRNYVLFLIIQVLITYLENYLISRRINKIYPYLNRYDKMISKSDKKEIVKNTSSIMMHRIGDVLLESTDNIMLSSIVGLDATALYSNYNLITASLNSIVTHVYSSLSASIGNLCIKEKNQTQCRIFYCIDFVTFWIFSFCSVCLLCLANPFIRIWIGDNFLFSFDIVIVLVINFYLSGMRRAVLVFRDAKGIFSIDRAKAIFEVVVNIVASVVLGKMLGTIGIFLGTLISLVLTCIIIEPYVLFRFGFRCSFVCYFERYIKYLIITICMSAITYCLCMFTFDNALLELIAKSLICLVVPNSILFVLFRKTGEFGYFVKKIIIPVRKKMIKLVRRRK